MGFWGLPAARCPLAVQRLLPCDRDTFGAILLKRCCVLGLKQPGRSPMEETSLNRRS